ncbi:methyltransferase domain-containing protein [Nocardioides sp. W3-2-3]|uniref:class I SAM-dependent methyltransferase n=1 Tax=Nocardioides convexus TaxID=2712224 RepID=UPI00241857CD|nr:methyltransferase domain-containing protein [Nocardioides convexus]NHA01545.1 methyltransferase domain-containing protein [Nocardioides convexus]
MGWSDRADLVLPDTVGLDDISVEERAAWVASKRSHAAEAAQVEVLDELGARLDGGPRNRTLYDIGTGDGQFLSVAGERGYQVRGNDLIEANVHLAERSYGVPVDLGDLSALDVPGHDAVTMWCVLAHVADPEALLQRLLRPAQPGRDALPADAAADPGRQRRHRAESRPRAAGSRTGRTAGSPRTTGTCTPPSRWSRPCTRSVSSTSRSSRAPATPSTPAPTSPRWASPPARRAAPASPPTG